MPPSFRAAARSLALLLAAGVLTSGCASRAGSAAPPGDTRTPAEFDPWKASPSADGTSVEKAVLVLADNEEDGVAWERRWIFDHYGRYRRKSVGLTAANGRHYDVFVVELADHSEKTIFFDCTGFLGKEKK